tara:strand:+ start:322 stop:531 length:210 start_codon:yes stop_codon:yes gene_type:complete
MDLQKIRNQLYKMFGSIFTNKKKIIKQLLDMVEYLIADNSRLRQKMERIEHRQGLRFGGTQDSSKIQKK